MSKLDTQGWIDATNSRGEPYDFFVRDDRVWVRRRDGKYKWMRLDRRKTIAGARMLAGVISQERGLWQSEAVAKKACPAANLARAAPADVAPHRRGLARAREGNPQ